MKLSSLSLPSWTPPRWLRNDQPLVRGIVTLGTLFFISVQALGNMPYSSLRSTFQPVRRVFDTLGLYQRGWGMFAATNTNTSVTRIELLYSNGDIKREQLLYLMPGYRMTAWNEVQQDLQFDDNNDRKGKYLTGFLEYSCKQYDTNRGNPLVSIAFQQQTLRIPADKKKAEREVPYVTRRTQVCRNN
ncbi:MAG TPA: hypothetical protein VLA04_02000 [Verrucomicrobiae bacterium]|nr:hypothetical protein [Verrucomicrobiae bacterium]